ncbi:MAG: HEAT repeat domain-containing protein [Chloroflexota bacterium]|nr:HEAT repeat domain-containing protein [Chloroflexota bacterium]MDQ5867049.1 HEAT repeat domain-containing protein [Chloroflexota bacterium]
MVGPNDSQSVAELVALALTQDPENQDYWDTVYLLQSYATLEVFETAKQLCQSDNARDRELGADLLGQGLVRDKNFPAEKVPILLQILATEEDPNVLSATISALGRIGTPERIDPLLKLVDHLDHEVRYHLAISLSQTDDARAIEGLIALSTDPDSHVRDWAMFGLGSQTDVDTPALREALLARITDTDYNTRCEALVGLAKRNDPRVLEPLIHELQSDSLGLMVLEAASQYADSRLCPVLLKLKEKWLGDEDSHTVSLQDALVSCGCISQEASYPS